MLVTGLLVATLGFAMLLPALVDLAIDPAASAWFVVAMVAGLGVSARFLTRR